MKAEVGAERRAGMTRVLAILGAVAAATLLGGWAFDRQGPYCHFDREFTNCSYPSFEACTAAARGVGGVCSVNPQYVAPEERHARRRRAY